MTELLLIIAFVAGYVYRDFQFFRTMSQMPDKDLIKLQSNLQVELKKINQELNSLGVKNVYKLKHEIVSDVHYFFTENDDTFVGQGKTLEDAAAHYTKLQGKDVLGWFTHIQQNKNYCFVNDKCMEFEHEQH
jgi:hypothetical protein